MSYDLDNAPLPSHWFRRDPESGDWNWVPSVPPQRPAPEWAMSMAEWLDYRASGFDGSPRDWWLAQRAVEVVGLA